MISVTIYTVLYARPILEVYVQLLPTHLRDSGTRAFARGSEMVIGWMWSNVIAGVLDAIAVGIFLSLMGVPGALIWSALALFAELIPLLGIYLMAIPPILVALSINPLSALWVALFYVILNETMGRFIMPHVRSTMMDIHPVFLLFVLVAMGSVFGLIGALSAAPLAAFAKAYYEEFYLARRPHDPEVDERVEVMVNAGVDGVNREG